MPERIGPRVPNEKGRRVNLYNYYNSVMIPEGICRYRGLSPGAKLVLARIVRYQGADGSPAFPKLDTLGYECGISGRQAWSYLRELESEGFIECVQHGLHQPNEYYALKHNAYEGYLGEARMGRKKTDLKDASTQADLKQPSVQEPTDASVAENVSPYCIKSGHEEESQREGSRPPETDNPPSSPSANIPTSSSLPLQQQPLETEDISEEDPTPMSPPLAAASYDTTEPEEGVTSDERVNQYRLVTMLEESNVPMRGSEKRAIRNIDGEWPTSDIRHAIDGCGTVKTLWRILGALGIDIRKPRRPRKNDAGAFGGGEKAKWHRPTPFGRKESEGDPIRPYWEIWNREIPSRPAVPFGAVKVDPREFDAAFETLIEEAKWRLERNPDDEWVSLSKLLVVRKNLGNIPVWQAWLKWRQERLDNAAKRKPAQREDGGKAQAEALDMVLGKYKLER